MATNLLSGSDAAFRKNSSGWQDTSAPPNVIIRALGPGLISQALQRYNDVANQPYHRESMKGQTADVPNVQPLYALPPVVELLGANVSADVAYHRESVKGQADPNQNQLLAFGIFSPPGISGVLITTPFFKRKELVQDTTIQRNPVLDLVPAAQPPFKPNLFEAEVFHRDTLSGQYARVGAVVVTGPPFPQNELYTAIFKPKAAQEPFLFPNVVLVNVPATPQPFVQSAIDQNHIRGKLTQETYQFPNALLNLAPVQPAFVQRQTEDMNWRGKKTQEHYDFPNQLVFLAPPAFVHPFVERQYEDVARWGKYTQDHFVLPNNLIWQILPIVYTPLGLAIQIMASAGFTVNPVILWQYSTTVPYYMVISQLPIAGSVIEYQAVPIQLTASLGPPPPSAEVVTVPNVVGMTSLQAIQALNATPLNIGVVNFVQVNGGNLVTLQSPAAGTPIQSYSSINLTVDSGAPQDTLIGDLYTIPNVSPVQL